MTVPVDPRAKAIEVMARAMYEDSQWRMRGESTWDRTSEQESYRADARAALAALEQEGLVLTDTREEESDG